MASRRKPSQQLLMLDPFAGTILSPTSLSNGSWMYRGYGWTSKIFETCREAQHWFSTRSGVAPAFDAVGDHPMPVPADIEKLPNRKAADEPVRADPFGGRPLDPQCRELDMGEGWFYVGAGWRSKMFTCKELAQYWYSTRWGKHPTFPSLGIEIRQVEAPVTDAADSLEGIALPEEGDYLRAEV